MRPTTVISVRGKIPADLLRDPDFTYVGRRCNGWPASDWGNPFKVDRRGELVIDWRRVRREWWDSWLAGRGHDRGVDAVVAYEAWLRASPYLMGRLPDLRGKTLGCWCCDHRPGNVIVRPCHAIVLARLADSIGGRS